jgi:hypothetical protein
MLTKKDATGTVFVALAAIVYLAVTQAWGWPLLGGYRSGTLVLGAIGLFACAKGSNLSSETFKGPFVVGAGALGVVAFGLVVIGAITGSHLAFAALAIDIGVLYVLTIVHHVTAGAPPQRLHPVGG